MLAGTSPGCNATYAAVPGDGEGSFAGVCVLLVEQATVETTKATMSCLIARRLFHDLTRLPGGLKGYASVFADRLAKSPDSRD